MLDILPFIFGTVKSILLISFLFVFAGCNEPDPYASLDRRLTLNDFKAKPYVYARGLIVTEVIYKIESIDSTHYKPYVKCTIIPETIMHPKKSFITRNGFSEKDILLALKHEQCHYDISSLYAIEFKKATEASLFNAKALPRQVDSVLYSLRPKYDSIQLRFDKDATYANRQIDKWSTRLNGELKAGIASIRK